MVLTPTSAMEIYPITISGTRHTPDLPTPHDSVIVTATITSNNPITIAAVYADFGSGFTAWTMHDDGNHHDGAASDGLYGAALPPVTGETTIPYYVHAEDDLSSSVNDPQEAAATRRRATPHAVRMNMATSMPGSSCTISNPSIWT